MMLDFIDAVQILDEKYGPFEAVIGHSLGGMATLRAAKEGLKAKKNALSLRVFKISPAVNLYLRSNFVIESEDERFFNMVKNV